MRVERDLDFIKEGRVSKIRGIFLGEHTNQETFLFLLKVNVLLDLIQVGSGLDITPIKEVFIVFMLGYVESEPFICEILGVIKDLRMHEMLKVSFSFFLASKEIFNMCITHY